eukprot:547928_1
MAQLFNLKQIVLHKHMKLSQELEETYMNHITALYQQKRLIQRQMQQQFCKELAIIDDAIQKYQQTHKPISHNRISIITINDISQNEVSNEIRYIDVSENVNQNMQNKRQRHRKKSLAAHFAFNDSDVTSNKYEFEIQKQSQIREQFKKKNKTSNSTPMNEDDINAVSVKKRNLKRKRPNNNDLNSNLGTAATANKRIKTREYCKNILFCNNGHKLSYMSKKQLTKIYGKHGAECDIEYGKPGSIYNNDQFVCAEPLTNGGYHCDKCKYDVCKDCVKFFMDESDEDYAP